ncbi:MAG: hypothetical protein KF906_09075 [Actinobacteria bacterium]|nr:hypothetical protein [Actinomycetota bacterium]
MTEERAQIGGGGTADRFRVDVLGRFAVGVPRTGESLAVPPGLPSVAVKLVVANGGRAHVEAVMEALWPESSPAEGRKGVRNVLSRLARAGVPLLVRDGEAIRLADEVRVDAFAFRSLADRVLTGAEEGDAALGARRALAIYQGPFLPDDCYLDWTETPRHQLRRRQVALLDLLAADANRRGELMEAVHLLELALEADPLDDVRYLELAELLLAAGRRGRAAEMVDRSRQVLRDHGLLPGAAWARLQRELHQTRRASARAIGRSVDSAS